MGKDLKGKELGKGLVNGKTNTTTPNTPITERKASKASIL